MVETAEQLSPLAGLSFPQREAATAEDNTLAIAGPGSGKTSMLVARARYLLRQYPTSKIVMITFTRDAAKEMRNRISATESIDENRLNIGTFHAVCAKHLRDAGLIDGHLLAQGEEFVYYSRVAQKFNYDAPEEAARRIEAAKCNPESDLDNPQSENERAAAYYQKLLKQNHMRDFIDMIRMTVRGMNGQGEKPLGPIPGDFWLIDEFQDVDSLQYRLLVLLRDLNPHAVFTAIGDDDQSIYGWRGALGYKGMLNFERDFNARRTMLTTNFRSTSEVVESALRLIAGNASRYEKPLTSHRGPGGRVECKTYPNKRDEALAAITHLKAAQGTRAILARTNSQLGICAIECKKREIPFIRLSGGRGGVLGDEPACYLLTLMRAVVHPESRRGIEALWSTLRIGTNDRERLAGKNFSELESVQGELTGEAGSERVRELIKVLGEARTYAKAGPDGADDAIQTLADWVYSRIANVDGKSVIESAVKFLLKIQGPLSRRLRKVDSPSDGGAPERPGDAIVMATLHSAKGLEFDHVHIIGFQMKTIPHQRALALDEERRLAYVGVTRAKTELFLSASREGISPFWDEMNGGAIA